MDAEAGSAMIQHIEQLSREQLLADLEWLRFQFARETRINQRARVAHQLIVYKGWLRALPQALISQAPLCCRHCGQAVVA